MSREFYIKKFEGYRDKKGYFNELVASQRFPNITPKLISSSEENLEITYEFVAGDTEECSNTTLSLIGETIARIHSLSLSNKPWQDTWLTRRPLLMDDDSVKSSLLASKSRIEIPKTGVIHAVTIVVEICWLLMKELRSLIGNIWV